MNPTAPSAATRITRGRVVLPDRVVDDREVWIVADRIAAVLPAGTPPPASVPDEVKVIDAAGALVMPGLIDIHADYIEHMAAPRPTALMGFGFALREAERELITHGITTMFHSLSLYAYEEFTRNPIRSTENTRRLVRQIDASHDMEHLIHHRFHARFEIDNLARVPELEDHIRSGRVHLLSFMDHTPGQGQYRDLAVFRDTLKGYRNLSDAEIDRIIGESQSREKLNLETIRRLTGLATEHGIAVASHDDDSLERVDFVKSIGMTISEFPITIDVAHHAREAGMHTVAGAPNVLLGGSHSGNLSATEAVLLGVVDVLCSDYYPAAMLAAVFQLHAQHGVDLAEAVNLVTLNAARAVRVDHETGSLEAGKRADVLVVRVLPDGSPAVVHALVDGVLVYTLTYRGPRAPAA